MRWKEASVRFWEGVDTDSLLDPESKNDCWLWTKSKSDEGYGKFRWDKRHSLAHRYSYLLHYGELPDNLLVLHSCDNPSCVNPKHLFLGTDKDNSDDRDAKKRNVNYCGDLNGNSKLDDDIVREIRYLSSMGVAYKYLAQQFKVSSQLISMIVRRKIWKHVTE